MIWTQQDKALLQSKGITEAQAEAQLKSFETGFPFLQLEAAAAVGAGIVRVSEDEAQQYASHWKAYTQAGGHSVEKFVPASGAASRMFKDLFAFLDAEYDAPTTDFEKHFFAHLQDFAFIESLSDACMVLYGMGPDSLVEAGRHKDVVAALLGADGLNYGQLPKGLLQFHRYDDSVRTPMEEHLVEAALYASSDGVAKVHFTVSHEHLPLFRELVEAKKADYEQKFGIRYDITFSEQKPSTDTIAAAADNQPFRNDDGTLLFRPGGHGALIQNLGDLTADIVFVKNIDNVVPDRLKAPTVQYKQVIAGILVDLQEKAFQYLRLLDTGTYTHQQIEEIIRFVQNDLCTRNPNLKDMEDTDLVLYLRQKLNRPMRVCGVVKNVGEPGGGPFVVKEKDGSQSLQILESSQIDTTNPEYMKMFTQGTHFNPVDLVCALKDYKGQRFDLTQYVDPEAGFISHKSKSGRELKALELPGLWNGAMSNWCTLFVEVPLETFNPVKTVNDLLRDQHQ